MSFEDAYVDSFADKSRSNSPLKIDQEAIVIDTSDLTIDEVVSMVLTKADQFATN